MPEILTVLIPITVMLLVAASGAFAGIHYERRKWIKSMENHEIVLTGR